MKSNEIYLPDLITKKALKKILKKNNKHNTNNKQFLTKSFHLLTECVKINWLPILVISVAIIILIHLYIDQRKKKEEEKIIAEGIDESLLNKENYSNYDDDFKNKPNYESEYYKMLPRITNQPDVIPYMY